MFTIKELSRIEQSLITKMLIFQERDAPDIAQEHWELAIKARSIRKELDNGTDKKDR